MNIDGRLDKLSETALPRVDLARARSEALLEDISSWRQSEPVRTSLHIREAPACGWFVRVEEVLPPPMLEQWGIQLAEVAYHLRSILNTTLTRIVIEEGGEPSRQLQFPISHTHSAWKKDRKRIRSLPERVQRIIYGLQPFLWARETGELAQNHVLSVLNWINNQDKHQLEIEGSLEPSFFEHYGWITTPDGMSRQVNPTFSFDWSLATGSHMVTADTSPNVVHSLGRTTLDLQIEVLFPDELGTTTEVRKLLEEIWNAYQQAFLSVVFAWADQELDYRFIAGASDFSPGAAFGKAAVDSVQGAGTWDGDWLSRRLRGNSNDPITSSETLLGGLDILGADEHDVRFGVLGPLAQSPDLRSR